MPARACHPHPPRPFRGDAHTRRPTTLLIAVALALLSTGAAAQGAEPANPDKRCLRCHGQAKIADLGPAERRSMVGTLLDVEVPTSPPAPLLEKTPADPSARRPGLYIRSETFATGPHAGVRCVECHQDAATLPHTPVLRSSVCATTCHAEPAAAYKSGAHSAAHDANRPLAPTCASCHGGHQILRVTDRQAPQNRLNSLHLCGDCHQKHSPAATNTDPKAWVADYMDSTHAKAITKAGLPMAATCSDCHDAHGVRPASDPDSTVNRRNIPQTCGKCHVGVVEIYQRSVHGRKNATLPGSAAVCTDCHTAHRITLASSPKFMLDIINECGRCHDSPDATGDRVGTYYQSYARSYHGQVTRLGTTRAAKCSDCHGSHAILPVSDPASRVAKANLVTTCAACHSGANANFVDFDPHANHRDARNFPVLHGVWLYFMVMMSSVFTFFGVHTLLWFFRARRENRRHPHPAHPPAPTAIRRFSAIDRVNHLLVAVTFFGLTATGIPLVFSGRQWARSLADMVGGIEAAGLWHRVFAIALIANFILHFATLARRFINRKCSARQWLFGPASLVPRWKDVKDVYGMFRWFFRSGRPPRLDRWTYWEKFDYWAEVGGSMIIGGSGLLLWFPELASRILPGRVFNIAMIVHGYEALLAIGFIFTIHFFNAHLRPGTFPVDAVIFTGSLPEHELKAQRPEEYDRLVKSGQLESLRVRAPSPARRPLIVLIAVVSVAIGLTLLGLIIAGGLA